ncbi:MAG: serine hydrolase [Oscillospiraceae bacterium]|nr:serine hydrolase [Oscillospiraceae bacterium]
MKKVLKRVSPETHGISSSRTEKLLRDLNSLGNEVHGFLLAVDGDVICESFVSPYSPNIPHSCHSLGKSYTATAVGLAVTQGLVSVEDRVVDIFKDEIESLGIDVKPGMEKVRIRDVLSMSSGTKGMPMFNDFWFENFLSSEIVHEPGTTFLYNTTGASLLGAVVEKVTGQDMVSYLKNNLFRFIGIEDDEIVWQKFADGRTAEPGLCATTEANLRLGMLYAENGKAYGKQLIDPEWMREATSLQVENGPVHGADNSSAGYGWQLWLNTTSGMFRFDGGQGQLCIIWPEKHAVAAIHQSGRDPEGCNNCIQAIQDFMEELTGSPLPEDPDAYRALLDYSSSLHLPALPSSAIPDSAFELFGTYLMTEGSFVPYIEVAPGNKDFWYLFHDRSLSPETVALELRPKNDAVLLTLNRDKNFLCALDGKWRIQDVVNPLRGLTKVASCGEFLEDGSLHIILKWLNGWSMSDVLIRKGDHPGDLLLTNVKDMLHEYLPPVIHECKLRKVRL